MNENISLATMSNLQDASTLNVNVMDMDDIRRFAPKVFCTEPTNPMLSKYYTFASTETVINDMKKLGWDVVLASQPHQRRNSKGISSYHMVSFQRPDYKITKTDAEGNVTVEAYPRIILTNSHDGFSSFCFRIGIYRCVCANGLVVATQDFESVRLRHMGYTFDELRKLVDEIVAMVPDQITVMNKMQYRELTLEEKRHLALIAIRERRGDDELEVPDYMLDEVLEPIRPEDEGDNLWITMNVIQEKMISGDFQFIGKRGKARKARALKSIAKRITINQGLFKTAAAMVA